MRRSSLFKRCGFWAVGAILALPAVARAEKVTVDGDLTDIIAVAQADQSDPPFDVTDAFVSGWDFTHVYVFYHQKNDTLYIGLQLQDGEHAGVPGDADGDADPNDTSRPDVPEDQFGVGTDEAYIISFDTDIDGDFETVNDLLLLYRNNSLNVFRGNGTQAPDGMVLNVALGTKGDPDDPGMPNQNRNTEDIEFSIRNISLGIFDPCLFSLNVYAGSLVDALDEDRLDISLTFNGEDQPLKFGNEVSNDDGSSFEDDCVSSVAGGTVKVRASFTNNSAFTLQNVYIIHHIPTGLDYVEGSVVNALEGRQFNRDDGTIIRHIQAGGGTLPPGGTVTITFDVDVNSLADAPILIRGFGEGVVKDPKHCMTSCIDLVCVEESSGQTSGGPTSTGDTSTAKNN